MAHPEGFGPFETFLLVLVKLFDLGVGDMDLALDPAVEQILGDEVHLDAFFQFILGESAGL